ncbi:MAG: YdcF family protein [Acutalibacteraceae bacterium]
MSLFKNAEFWKITVRVITFTIFAAGLLWYVVPMSIGIVNIGNVLGAMFCVAGMGVSLFWVKFKLIVKMLDKSFVGAVFIRFTAVMIIFAMLFSIVTAIVMAVYANKKPSKQSTLVLLGCKVNGSSPSLMLSRRISAAYDYLTENEDAVCVLSGGKGYNEGISEAECMYNELVKRGIDGSRLYLEDKSTTTYENLKFSYEIIKENGLNENIAIATDGFHQLRASMIADKLNISVSGAVSADTPLFLFGTYFTREIVAVLAQILGLSK